MSLNAEQIGWIIAAIGFVAAGYEKWQSSRKATRNETEQALINDAKMHKERSELLKAIADENLAMFQKEHAEHLHTREYWHTKSTKDQALMSELQARPDYTDIMRHMETQAQLMTEVLTGLKNILEQIKPHLK